MDGYRFDPAFIQVLHLVLHQGYERGDDEREAVPHQGRNLEADGLAAARGEDGEYVLPLQGGLYDFALHRAETVVSPVFLEYLPGCHQTIKR